MGKGYLFRQWYEEHIGLDTHEKQNTFVICRNQIEKLDAALPQADVIKSVCVCGRELDAMDLQVAQCYKCSIAVLQTVL